MSGSGAGAQHHPSSRAQGPQRTGRAQRKVVRRGEHHEIHAVLVHRTDLVRPAERVQVVVVRTRNQFRNAGAAAGQLEERQVRGGRPVLVRNRCTRDRAQRRVLPRLPHDEDMAERRGPLTHLGGEVAVVEALVPVGDDVGDRLGERAEVPDLRLTMGGQCEHRQRADPEQREDHLEELGDVRQLDHHSVALADSCGEEACREPVGAVVEFAVGPAPPGAGRVHDGDPVRVPLGACAQHPAEGLALPVPGCAVAGGEIGGPGRCAGAHSLAPTASRKVRNLALVSAVSAAGSDVATTPAPA